MDFESRLAETSSGQFNPKHTRHLGDGVLVIHGTDGALCVRGRTYGGVGRTNRTAGGGSTKGNVRWNDRHVGVRETDSPHASIGFLAWRVIYDFEKQRVPFCDLSKLDEKGREM